MRYFVISDTHFNHSRIIDYCNRPFRTDKEMNEEIIKRWNETVTNNDVIIHLGDFALGSRTEAAEIGKRLNGKKKILILGNHDNWSEEFYRTECGFHTVSRFPIIYNDFFIMSHAPQPLVETTPYFNFYGHVHNDNKYIDNATSKCVSVERIGYRPYLMFEDNK